MRQMLLSGTIFNRHRNQALRLECDTLRLPCPPLRSLETTLKRLETIDEKIEIVQGGVFHSSKGLLI
jgi:hypothetical protein